MTGRSKSRPAVGSLRPAARLSACFERKLDIAVLQVSFGPTTHIFMLIVIIRNSVRFFYVTEPIFTILLKTVSV